MKKNLFCLFLLMFFSTICCFGASKDSKYLYIAIDSAPLKVKPSASSKTVETVEYSSAVCVIKTQKNWSYVQLVNDDSIEGWIPTSSLTTKKLKQKGKAASANADEIALAGKGFTSTVESIYAEESSLSFSDVDLMENFGLPFEDIVFFAEDGSLNFESEVDAK